LGIRPLPSASQLKMLYIIFAIFLGWLAYNFLADAYSGWVTGEFILKSGKTTIYYYTVSLAKEPFHFWLSFVFDIVAGLFFIFAIIVVLKEIVKTNNR
jgi:TRAP-type C4-dicarboxylate transport system permease small subunit